MRTRLPPVLLIWTLRVVGAYAVLGTFTPAKDVIVIDEMALRCFDQAYEAAFPASGSDDEMALRAMVAAMLQPRMGERGHCSRSAKAFVRAVAAAVHAKDSHNTTQAWEAARRAFSHSSGRVLRDTSRMKMSMKEGITNFLASPFWTRLRRNQNLGRVFTAIGTGAELALKSQGLDLGTAGSIIETLWLLHRIFTDTLEYIRQKCYLPAFWPFSCFLPDHCLAYASITGAIVYPSRKFCWFAGY